MSEYNRHTDFYDVQVVENGVISHWTTSDGGDMINVYQDCENGDSFTKVCKEITRDIKSLLHEWSSEGFVSHYKITLTVESLSEEGGAA